MKKQNQTKLAFNKANVSELNVQQLRSVNGGVKDDLDLDTKPGSGCICDPILTKLTVIKNQF